MTLALLLLAQTVRVRCPVDDDHQFPAREPAQLLAMCGVDYDTCIHAQALDAAGRRVYTCPRCYFTGEPDEFIAPRHNRPEQPMPIEQLERLRAAPRTPAAPIAANARQDQIPGWVKFDLWAQSLSQRGVNRGLVAKAFLFAAWEFRRAGAPLIEDIDEFDALWDRYEAGLTYLDLRGRRVTNVTDHNLERARTIEADVAAGTLAGIDATLGLYLAAFLYRRHGENADALRIADALAPAAEENTFLGGALAGLRASIGHEREWQRRALGELQAAADDRSTPARDRGDVAYLAGETCRRIGEFAAARAWYQRVIDDPRAADGTKNWARAQMDKLPAPE